MAVLGFNWVGILGDCYKAKNRPQKGGFMLKNS
jgi:hypothetical protein